MKNIVRDNEFKGLKGHDVGQVAQMDFYVSHDTSIAQGGYKDH